MDIITKDDLSKKIVGLGLLKNRTEARLLLDTIFLEIENSLLSGKNVSITNFGVFFLKDKKSRPIKMPRGQMDIVAKDGKKLFFKQSNSLKYKIGETYDS